MYEKMLEEIYNRNVSSLTDEAKEEHRRFRELNRRPSQELSPKFLQSLERIGKAGNQVYIADEDLKWHHHEHPEQVPHGHGLHPG